MSLWTRTSLKTVLCNLARRRNTNFESSEDSEVTNDSFETPQSPTDQADLFRPSLSTSTRHRRDKNTPIAVVDLGLTHLPPPQSPRLKAQPVTLSNAAGTRKGECSSRNRGTIESANFKTRVEQVLRSMTVTGYETLCEFVEELLNVHDQRISSTMLEPNERKQPRTFPNSLSWSGLCQRRNNLHLLGPGSLMGFEDYED